MNSTPQAVSATIAQIRFIINGLRGSISNIQKELMRALLLEIESTLAGPPSHSASNSSAPCAENINPGDSAPLTPSTAANNNDIVIKLDRIINLITPPTSGSAPTYAQIAGRTNIVEQPPDNVEPLLLIPTCHRDSTATQQLLKANINTRALGVRISSVKTATNGNISIYTTSKSSRDKLKEVVDRTLSTTFKTSIPAKKTHMSLHTTSPMTLPLKHYLHTSRNKSTSTLKKTK